MHKMIGYGLTDVQTEGYEITDPRINTDSPLLNFRDDEVSLDQFIEFLEASDDKVQRHFYRDRDDKQRRHMKPMDSVVLRTEYGLPNVLCVRPVWMTDWARYDDIIDWIEETHLREPDSQGNWVKVLPHPIYPFSGLYADMRTGSRLKGPIMDWIRVRSSVTERNLDLTEHEGMAELLDLLAVQLGFKDHAEADKFVMPEVPDDIVSLVTFGSLLTSDDVLREFRPMIYVYWG